ncbi:MAG: 50S ribosomal protein L5, partial [Rubripirellula sp.]|nr:50S ribosomal protein L5 [Rubripirellula sp.]
MSDSKPRLQTRYEETIRQAMVDKHGYVNAHQIPCVEKITMNMGVGSAIGDKKILDLAIDAMTQISGQKPVITNARKSIANFRLREGMPIGCMVT